jgi:hypothetical protein
LNDNNDDLDNVKCDHINSKDDLEDNHDTDLDDQVHCIHVLDQDDDDIDQDSGKYYDYENA